MILPATARVWAQKENLSAELLAGLAEAEAEHVRNVGDRDDTAALIVTEGQGGKLLAYAILGMDEGGMVVIYAANTFLTGLGKMALQALLGASEVLGAPLRVHSEKVQAMARAMGASEALETLDAEGIPMGVFRGQ